MTSPNQVATPGGYVDQWGMVHSMATGTDAATPGSEGEGSTWRRWREAQDGFFRETEGDDLEWLDSSMLNALTSKAAKYDEALGCDHDWETFLPGRQWCSQCGTLMLAGVGVQPRFLSSLSPEVKP